MNWAAKEFHNVNVLINNAGIQKEVRFNEGIYRHDEVLKEIETNFTAVVHLCALFISKFSTPRYTAIVNITSGLAFTPLAITPIYCATKAALHSFSLSLRHQLSKTPVRVFEIAPPMVDTELDQGTRDKRQSERGMKPEDFASQAIDIIGKDIFEAAVGMAANLREKRETAFGLLNRRLSKNAARA